MDGTGRMSMNLDKFLFGKYSGSEVKLGDEEYLIMREEDIAGILALC